MRNLEECTAEVFKRSEKIIAERKKNRKRAVLYILPICLVAFALSLIVFGRDFGRGNDIIGGEKTEEPIQNGISHETEGEIPSEDPDLFRFFAAKIKSSGIEKGEKSIEDETAVCNLVNGFAVLFNSADKTGETAAAFLGESSNQSVTTEETVNRIPDGGMPEGKYTVTLTGKSGNTRTLEIVNDVIFIRELGIAVRVDKTELSELLEEYTK